MNSLVAEWSSPEEVSKEQTNGRIVSRIFIAKLSTESDKLLRLVFLVDKPPQNPEPTKVDTPKKTFWPWTSKKKTGGNKPNKNKTYKNK
jgi:hypothetical protein